MFPAQEHARHREWLRLAEQRLQADPEDPGQRKRAVQLCHYLGRWPEVVTHAGLALAAEPLHLTKPDATSHAL